MLVSQLKGVESPCVAFLSVIQSTLPSIVLYNPIYNLFPLYPLDPWVSQQDIQTLLVAVDAGQMQGRAPRVRHGANEPGAVDGFAWKIVAKFSKNGSEVEKSMNCQWIIVMNVLD